MSSQGVVTIHGKDYQTVAKRIADFKGDHKDKSVETEIVSMSEVVVIKATIKNEEGRVLSTGYAEEVRGSTNINKTSALENCETSAVGRALAFVGYGGEQIASSNEVIGAIAAGAKKEVADYFIRYAEFVRDNYQIISEFKDAFSNGDMSQAVMFWYQLDKEVQEVIYKLAPTKGGVLTTEERNIMKSNEWAEARNEQM